MLDIWKKRKGKRVEGVNNLKFFYLNSTRPMTVFTSASLSLSVRLTCREASLQNTSGERLKG